MFRINVFVTLVTLLVSLANSQEPQVVQKITNLDVFIQTSNPPNLVVNAEGLVPTSGYSNVRLLRATYAQPPADGIQDYFLVATPPSGPAATVISVVTAADNYHAFTVNAPWLNGVRVHGIGDGIALQKFGDGLRVRKNILSLTSAEIATLEHGVQVMKSRAASDRRSWWFQANIHGETSPANDPLWNQCQHGTRQFFPWHRAYLLEFENILREASGDDQFTLPYWDWSTAPSLPTAFRISSSPLFDSTRSINNGQLLPNNVVVSDLFNSLNQVSFNSFSNMFEGSPHGAVHVLIGGRMGSVPTAANDPIFWLHHCNIDRVWDSWIALGGGRQNPADTSFLNREFTFANTTGGTVTHRVGDLLDSAALGYRYADISNRPSTPTPLSIPRPAQMAAMARADQDQLVASSVGAAARGEDASSNPLGLDATQIELKVREQGKPELQRAASAAAPASAQRIVVDVVGLKAKAAPRFTYAIYLNLAENDTSAESKQLHRVATLNLFGIADHANHEHAPDGDHANHDASREESENVQHFDATQVIAKLREAGLWDGSKISVTFEPVTPIATNAEDRSQLENVLKESAEKSGITYERIDVRITNDE